MQRSSVTEALLAWLDLPGKRIVEVGAGEGSTTRFMAAKGAHVLAVECGAKQLERARAVPAVAGERIIEGVGQDLPAEDASADIVIFINSLHHVPVADQRQALAEAARVLVDGGLLYIAEPLAEGPSFELSRKIDDETEVRAAAYQAIMNASSLGFEPLKEAVHLQPRRVESFEAFRANSIAIDPSRSAKFERLDAEMRGNFERLSVPLPDGGHELIQPVRANLLRRLPR
jgi:ubiquinone/menaquinone biosynthesis C-methylase UbiE